MTIEEYKMRLMTILHCLASAGDPSRLVDFTVILVWVAAVVVYCVLGCHAAYHCHVCIYIHGTV